MVSKNQLKQILKLKHKKYRTRLGFFVAEGEKIVNDLINSSWHAQSLYSLEDNFHPKAIKIDFSCFNLATFFCIFPAFLLSIAPLMPPAIG